MTFYAVLDSRRGQPWIWTDSLSSQRQVSLDSLIAFVRALPDYRGLTRSQQLKKARRGGLRVVKVRVELVR